MASDENHHEQDAELTESESAADSIQGKPGVSDRMKKQVQEAIRQQQQQLQQQQQQQ
jgi:hypothetical protein